MAPNARGALDGISDALGRERRIRVLSVIDTGTREARAIEVNTALPSSEVIRVLAEIIREGGQPSEIIMDNGPELPSRRLDR